ncbi:hypothetical protein D3C85_1782520 [compost metagenome]
MLHELLAFGVRHEAADLQMARRRHEYAGEHFDRRRFAGPVLPDISADLPLRNLKRNIFHGGHFIVFPLE